MEERKHECNNYLHSCRPYLFLKIGEEMWWFGVCLMVVCLSGVFSGGVC